MAGNVSDLLLHGGIAVRAAGSTGFPLADDLHSPNPLHYTHVSANRIGNRSFKSGNVGSTPTTCTILAEAAEGNRGLSVSRGALRRTRIS